MGTTAHKQGHTAGTNAVGGTATFAGSLGTQAVKVFDLVAAGTGLRDATARRITGRLLGAQLLGHHGVEIAKRVDIYATDPAPAPDTFDRAALTDPALTGISRADLAALAAALAAPQQAAREKASHDRLGTHRRRAPGAGRRPKLTLNDQITAALLHQRLALPTALLARLLGVGTDAARHGIREAQQLLDEHGFTPKPPAAHLSTLAGLSRYAQTRGAHPPATTKSAC